jgi:hypothetical protein
VHDDDDNVPGRICGRPLPCRDHGRRALYFVPGTAVYNSTVSEDSDGGKREFAGWLYGQVLVGEGVADYEPPRARRRGVPRGRVGGPRSREAARSTEAQVTNDPRPDNPAAWHTDPANVRALFRWLWDEFVDAADALYLLEKPWKYEDEWREYQSALAKAPTRARQYEEIESVPDRMRRALGET